jgi:hypothetical protein
LCDINGQSPLLVASSSAHYNIVDLLTAPGALHEENVKAQYKTIFKRTNDNEIFVNSNPCGYPEEEISQATEKREEEKEAINITKNTRREGRNNSHKRTGRKRRNNVHEGDNRRK